MAKFVLVHPDPRKAAVAEASDLSVTHSHPAVQRVVAGSHGDAVVLERQWNDKTKKLFSEIRVDDVRRVNGLFQQASSAGGYRVCIIDTAEDLNRSSANALLKLVEEPPVRSLFLILAHQPSQVMATLVSRCRRLVLAGLQPSEIVAAVQGLGEDWATLPPDRIAAAAERARGSVGRALDLLQGGRLQREVAVQGLLSRMPEVDWRAVHGLADSIGMSDDAFGVVLGVILDWLGERVRAIAATGRAPALAAHADTWAKIRASGREADVLNLDKRPVLLGIFSDLAEITRTA